MQGQAIPSVVLEGFSSSSLSSSSSCALKAPIGRGPELHYPLPAALGLMHARACARAPASALRDLLPPAKEVPVESPLREKATLALCLVTTSLGSDSDSVTKAG